MRSDFWFQNRYRQGHIAISLARHTHKIYCTQYYQSRPNISPPGSPLGLIGGSGAFASEVVLTGTGELSSSDMSLSAASGELSAGGDVPEVVSEEVDACGGGDSRELFFFGSAASSSQ